jgi:hypothetical protein|tara:strand:- start:89 stop:487 length:399 start_codon:yes stop_codon:yes gene_type:complete
MKQKFGKILETRIKKIGKRNINGHNIGDLFPTLTGPQKEQVAKAVLNHEHYMHYKGAKTAVRMTIPIIDRKSIQSASQELKDLSRQLQTIQRDTSRSVFQRCVDAQEAITRTNFSIKSRSYFMSLYGIHGLR